MLYLGLAKRMSDRMGLAPPRFDLCIHWLLRPNPCCRSPDTLQLLDRDVPLIAPSWLRPLLVNDACDRKKYFNIVVPKLANNLT